MDMKRLLAVSADDKPTQRKKGVMFVAGLPTRTQCPTSRLKIYLQESLKQSVCSAPLQDQLARGDLVCRSCPCYNQISILIQDVLLHSGECFRKDERKMFTTTSASAVCKQYDQHQREKPVRRKSIIPQIILKRLSTSL
ncbi:uncharacterized protein LOC144228126 [Crocuta crocuta]